MFDKKIQNSAVYFFDGNFLVSLYEYGVFAVENESGCLFTLEVFEDTAPFAE